MKHSAHLIHTTKAESASSCSSDVLGNDKDVFLGLDELFQPTKKVARKRLISLMIMYFGRVGTPVKSFVRERVREYRTC